MEPPNPKCKVCGCYWKPEGKDIKPSGLVAKSCPRCRKYQQDKRDYQKGKIYTITSPTSNDVYVGSTITSLRYRMVAHISDWKNGIVLGKHKDIVKDIKEWNIKLYEEYPCNSLKELLNREGEVIKEIGTLNTMISKIGNKECIIENSKNLKNYQKNNKDDFEKYIEKQKDDLKKYIEEQKDDLKKYIEEEQKDLKKYIEEQKDFNETRIKNAYIYNQEQLIRDKEYQNKLTILEEEYDNDNDEEMRRKLDENIDYTMIYMKKMRDKRKNQKINEKIDKIEQCKINGIIYTHQQMKKICRLNNITIPRGNTKLRMIFELSKIENLLIPKDLQSFKN
jgi:vacuolar-type H+-ATPase subunit I/STV1